MSEQQKLDQNDEKMVKVLSQASFVGRYEPPNMVVDSFSNILGEEYKQHIAEIFQSVVEYFKDPSKQEKLTLEAKDYLKSIHS